MNIYKITFEAIKGRLKGTHITYVAGENQLDAKLNFYEYNHKQILQDDWDLQVVKIEELKKTGEYIKVLY